MIHLVDPGGIYGNIPTMEQMVQRVGVSAGLPDLLKEWYVMLCDYGYHMRCCTH
jgi:hypothetical protein